ncbi:endonuclease/exonuclease/phosphatase family protein [Sinomicrobium kalidii]|uniref:endonuclease/exonuclease/phosphatase family protein n=1 Tax=Sinomicrobium kalidii TaxID=2900738 RepID=UPI001E2A1104|nr:endonuclease/exonuclease/phosphatase family protein [Sinomicrobium kalidii]UGU17647.1 endonuclease/exonuclease/phosphatase family protein [Sinomicrobium kalidii]
MRPDSTQNKVRNCLLSGIFFLMFCAFSMAQENKASLKVISANIRVALSRDKEKGHGWDSRKDLLFDILKSHQPDIICLQEVLEVQNSDLKDAFPGFTALGFEGPEMDAHQDGEYHGIAKNPIMFSREKYELISAGTYWLSETPQLGGTKSWNTARARHVNWVRLKDRATNREFRVLNTHLDHVSSEARKRQVSMIVEEGDQYPEDFPQLLTGDFNADIKSAPIDMVKTRWIDSYAEVHGEEDPGHTVHGFKGREYGKNSNKKHKGKVDFIFYRGPVKARSAKVIRDNRNGVYPSDHYFVSVELAL